MPKISPDWIAVDWGTSHLRAWALDGGGAVLARAASDDGMGHLSPEGFEPALLRLIDGWLPEGRVTPALACGMVGARQGWLDAGYLPLPFGTATRLTPKQPAVLDRRLQVAIVPGIAQSEPADVMRGEETQVLGWLAGAPRSPAGQTRLMCLPGTHSKWVCLRDGAMVAFRSFMTGELFALLAGQSVLRHAVADAGWDDQAFATALTDMRSAPAMLTAQLFALRAGSLLQGLPPAAARARLSGLLIGAELAAVRALWPATDDAPDVVLVGDGALAAAYASALAAFGLRAVTASAEGLTLRGLRLIHHHQAHRP